MTNEELVARIQRGENELMSTLWTQVERFIIKRANQFHRCYYQRCAAFGVIADDLYQMGYFGIYKAVQRYNADKGVTFLTYAGYWLMSEFGKAIKTHLKETPNTVSLDAGRYQGNEGLTLADTLIDYSSEAAINDVVEREYMREAAPVLDSALNKLPVEQRETIVNCFGRGLSYSGYAKERGVSRVTTRQSAEGALKRLRTDPDLLKLAY